MKKRFQIVLFAVLTAIVMLIASWQLLHLPRAPESPSTRALPDFIYSVRGYGGGGYDDFQFNSMKELGIEYVHGIPTLNWNDNEPRDDEWKWNLTDECMVKLAQYGLKSIPFIYTPKFEGLPWNSAITKNDPGYVAEYEEYAYELVKRYHTHPAWSGIVAVWGGSADIFGDDLYHSPEVVVPLQNAAYDGIKRADPNTIVVNFNMATTISPPEQFEDWHKRAFALSPKFDWFGVQTAGGYSTILETPNSYAHVLGHINVRKFLDNNGYADKPIFQNEAGVLISDLREDAHAEQVVENYIVARTLNINLKGWNHFAYFGKTSDSDEGNCGLMSSLDESDPPVPRLSWFALQTLIKTVKFFDYDFETKISGECNQSNPYTLKFTHRNNPFSKLWIVFSPRVSKVAPVTQNVTIYITPAKQAILIDMLGGQTTLTADAAGGMAITSASSPVYLKVDG